MTYNVFGGTLNPTLLLLLLIVALQQRLPDRTVWELSGVPNSAHLFTHSFELFFKECIKVKDCVFISSHAMDLK